VLETLSPPERLVFVLHDMFAVPFVEIATILERSPDATRQLASRACRRVRGAAAGRRLDGAPEGRRCVPRRRTRRRVGGAGRRAAAVYAGRESVLRPEGRLQGPITLLYG
jgi:RNA polymerase sigma-70 factor (ECF subfamily)